MTESVDEFFSEWFQSSADEVPNFKNVAILIQSYLSGSATALATSKSLFSELQPQYGSQGPRPSDIVEVFILPIAEDLQDTHENLVELLRALQVLSVSPQEGRGRQQTDEQLRTAWKKGLSLRYDLEERGLRYGDPDPDKGWLRDQLRDDWARVNRFAALVYVNQLEDGLWTFGESTLDFALRRKGWRVNWSWPDNVSDEIQALQGHAAAAAYWLIIAGRRLYREHTSIKERWIMWKEDLEWISNQDLYDETKLLCQEALAEMRRVQS